MTGLAGELFVAVELATGSANLEITFGTQNKIDLFAHCAHTGQNFTIQVKALRAKTISRYVYYRRNSHLRVRRAQQTR